MRHRKSFNHLSRKPAHRKAMLANMACSLIQHKRINTTVAKAKALRGYIEPLITKSKTDSTHSRRIVFSYLKDKNAVTELFREVAAKIGERPGGYTRILKTGSRLGDAADMCIIELVDYNETYIKEKKTKKTKTRRSRRGGGGKKKSTPAEAQDQQATDQKEITKAKTEDAKVEEDKAEDRQAETAKAEAKGTEAKKEEAPKTEAKKEEKPKAEKKEEPKAEAKKEEPKAEKKEAKTDKKEEQKDEKKDDSDNNKDEDKKSE